MSKKAAAVKESKAQAPPGVYHVNLQPQRKMLMVLGVVLVLWVVALIAMYFFTVRQA